MNVAILGTGYVGLTTGACLAYLGHRVACVDRDPSKIAALQRGEAPFYEPFLKELMNAASPNLCFTTEYGEAVPGAEVVFIAVGTPPGPNGTPDLKQLQGAARGIAEQLGEGFTVIVNKSTVPVGSGNWVEALVREELKKRHEGIGRTFAVASNPEFLREGSAIHDSLYPNRVVIGAEQRKTLEVLYELYRPLLNQSFREPDFLPRPEKARSVPLISTDLASAEIIKYAANAFLALKISYINEISRLAEKVGANIAHVARGIGLDERIGTGFLQAGIGWGGSCFGKDSLALIATASEYGLDMPIVTAAREVNRRQRERVVEKLLTNLKILKGRTIGLLGLAFKPETDDLREAPAIDLARQLIARGARVIAHDPVAMNRFRREYADLAVSVRETPEDVISNSDAVVLVTEWAQYKEIQWEAVAAAGERKRVVVLDGRQAIDGDRLTRAGYHYLSIVGQNPVTGFEPERDLESPVTVPLESREADCSSRVLWSARSIGAA